MKCFSIHNNGLISNCYQQFFYLAMGVLIGILILKSFALAAIFAFGLQIIYILSKRCEIVILILIILLSSIIYEEALPKIIVVGGSFYIADVLFLFLFFIILFKIFTNSRFNLTKTPLDLPLLLFYLSIIISAIISHFYYNIDFHVVTGKFRSLTYYLVFFIVTNLVQKKKQINLLIKGLFAIAFIVAITMLIQAIIGDSSKLLAGRVERAYTLGQHFDAERIIPPGDLLVYTFFITTGCTLVFLIRKNLFLFLSIFCMFMFLGIGVLLTYTRCIWVAAMFSFSILAFLISGDNKTRLISLIIMLLIISVTTIYFLGNYNNKINNYTLAVYARITSLLAGNKIIYSDTLNHRYIENKYALKEIKKHPIFGIGIGNNYRPLLSGFDDKLAYYIHNGYLFILLKVGIVGFICFICFYVGFIIRCFLYWKRIEDTFYKSIIVGFMLSGSGILLINIIKPSFMEWNNILLSATIIGISETIIRINSEKIIKN